MSEDELSSHISIIEGVTSGDEKILHDLEDYISDLVLNAPLKLIGLTCQTIMSEDDIPITSIRFSFIILNRLKPYISSNWSSFDIKQRDFIKETITKGILSGDIAIQNFASAVFAIVVEADKPMGVALELLKDIGEYMTNEEIPDQNKVGFVIALKELIQLNVLSPKTEYYDYSYSIFIEYLNFILSNPSEFGDDFFPIISCYHTILPFYKILLDNTNTKTLEYRANFIELIQSNLDDVSNPDFHDNLYQILFTYFQTCYETIINNMEDIFQITINSFSNDDVDLVIPSIRFWKEVANYEFQLTNEDKRNRKLAKKVNITIHNIAAEAISSLLNPIIEFIIKTACEEPPDPYNNDVRLCHEAAETLLAFGQLSPSIFSFVENNFDDMSVSPEWQVRYTSIILLWCITEGPNEIDQIEFFQSKFEQIISMLDDLSISVKDSVLWIIGIIFQKYQVIATNQDFFGQFMDIVSKASTAPYILGIRISDTVNFIGKLFRDIKDKNPMFVDAFPDLIDIMMETLEREDSPSTMLGPHCVEALSSLILSTPIAHELIIVELLHTINEKINQEITRNNIVPTEFIQMRIQFFCIIIWSVAKRLGSEIDPYSEPILNTLITLLSKKSVICQQEALIALCAMIKVLGNKTQSLIPQIIQIFIISQESKMKEIIEMSAFLISCLFQSLGSFLEGDVDQNKMIVATLTENLDDENVDMSAKFRILDALSEMVKALKSLIGTEFTEFFVSKLTEYQMVLFTCSDQFDDENTCILTKSLLNGYTSLILASSDSEYIDIIIQNYRQISNLFDKMVSFIPHITNDLMICILDFLNVVLKSISKRVNNQLHRRSVKSILEFISTSDDYSLAFQASVVLNSIKNC